MEYAAERVVYSHKGTFSDVSTLKCAEVKSISDDTLKQVWTVTPSMLSNEYLVSLAALSFSVGLHMTTYIHLSVDESALLGYCLGVIWLMRLLYKSFSVIRTKSIPSKSFNSSCQPPLRLFSLFHERLVPDIARIVCHDPNSHEKLKKFHAKTNSTALKWKIWFRLWKGNWVFAILTPLTKICSCCFPVLSINIYASKTCSACQFGNQNYRWDIYSIIHFGDVAPKNLAYESVSYFSLNHSRKQSSSMKCITVHSESWRGRAT